MSTQGDKMTLKYPFDTPPIENFYSVAVWRGKSASLDFFVLLLQNDFNISNKLSQSSSD